ncbi:MAG: putative membrane associated protein [Candidatus Methanohalarchaeum thermophilum]|uniref:UPF0182 protein BTN85_0328 n=1 Tax=Methanohalarchaeum thermophilum TaxID=1903181 RepID=A0A1Q6DU49_METT1|nr:MAG: putative membrane associated protein [Candidatus Methanohalarchaeum thermophilum]
MFQKQINELMKKTNSLKYILLGLFFLLILGAGTLVSIYTNWLWFGSLGFSSVFEKKIMARILLFVAISIFAFVVFYINYRFSIKYLRKSIDYESGSKQFPDKLALVLISFVSIGLGLIFSGNWQEILLFLNKTAYGMKDPIFSKDISFYFFSLPVYNLIKDLMLWLIILSIVLVSLIYLAGMSTPSSDQIRIESLGDLPKRGLKHVSVLLGLFFIILAANFYLNKFGLLFSSSGVVYGAGYTDINIVLPVLQFLMVLSILLGLILFYNLKLTNFQLIPASIGLLLVFSFIGLFIAPAVVQGLSVSPNELKLEEEYIENNINMTQEGFGLSKIQEKPFIVDQNITAKEIQKNNGTIDNIRLWDYRALKSTYEQLQELRLYYSFSDVDVDRYQFNGKESYKQVMLSMRELDVSKLPSTADTWVNRHLVYTHGFGMVMSPVNEKTDEGFPELILKDIPPKGILNISRPEIYYGEKTDNYVVVDTSREEFDYPSGEQNVYTSYKGEGGVKLNTLNEIAFSYRFNDIQLFLSNYIDEDSKVMFNRDIKQRVNELAPFLEYDSDPYPVTYDGGLYWIIDAYTTSDRFPYSEPTDGFNYVRNSVKVVVNAYSGEVTFYQINQDDPIINSWKKIFPSLFKDFEEMPSKLKEHIRYPEDYFDIQMDKYRTYHMEDPTVFYGKEDEWEIPREKYSGERIKVEPYYVTLSLPNNNDTEFVLIQPFSPTNKDNMVAWIGARSDMPHYGEIKHYQFTKSELILGTSQIEARIDQNPDISRQLTLWDQRGSEVIRGNLLVIPLDDSVLYVEPIFIRSEESALPELRRIIVSNGDKVVMSEELDKGLASLFGEVEEPPGPVDLRERIMEALQEYSNIKKYAGQGEWTEFGNSLGELGEILEELNQSIIPDQNVK